MSVENHRSKAEKSVGFLVVTVSDTRSLQSDQSGNRICQLLEEGGHRIVERMIVKDNLLDIETAVIKGKQHPEIQVLLFNGGTGIAGRDVTPEVVEEYFDKPISGFGELFRALSYEEIGPAAMLSRANGGITEGKVLFSIPGSPKAVDLAMRKLILPEVGHIVAEARKK